MDTGLNMNSGGQLDLQFPPPDLSTYEALNSYSSVAGPTRNRRTRPHLTTPYARNANRSAQTDDTSISWLQAIFSGFLSFPSVLKSLFSSVRQTSQRVSQRNGETTTRVEHKSENGMDVDQQQHNGSNNITPERLVQSNRIFADNSNLLNSMSNHRLETIQNNVSKRKRSEKKPVSVDVVEEELRLREQIEDQNHKPDLKELYYKSISPNWYKPFKNNPDQYPKFTSSSKVTSDTYGPDPDLKLPKESPPLKKFKPSVIPTSRWFDYYPSDKDEDIIDKKRTENIVEKRKVEEKTIEKEKALHKSKKGKEKADDINWEIGKEKLSGREKPGGKEKLNGKEKLSGKIAVVTATDHINPLKDQNFFMRPPVIEPVPFPSVGNIEKQSPLPSPIAGPSEIPITTNNKENNINNIITTPDTNSSSVKSPSSMESIEFTHETENTDLNLTPTPTPVPLTNSFAPIIKDKAEARLSTPWSNKITVNNENPLPFVSESKNDVLTDKSTPLNVSEKDNEQFPIRLFTESIKSTEKKDSLAETPQKKVQPTIINTEQKDTGNNSVGLSFGTNKDQPLLPTTSTTLASGTVVAFNSSNNESQQLKLDTPSNPFSENIKKTEGPKTDDGMVKEEGTKTIESQSQESPAINFQFSGVENNNATPFFATNPSVTDKKVLPSSSAPISTATATSTPSLTFSFGSTATSTASSAVPTGQPFKFNTEGFGLFGKSDKAKSYKPYASGSSNSRFRKNKRNCGVFTSENVPKTSADQDQNRLLVSTPGTFDFTINVKPESSSSSSPSLFGSQSENVQSQQIFGFCGFNGTQTQQTSSTSAPPIFGGSGTSNLSFFGGNPPSTPASGFGTSSTTMFSNQTSTFAYGTNSSHTGFGTGSIPSGNIFGSSSTTTGFTGFGAQNLPSNFNNQITQNGQPNNLFSQSSSGLQGINGFQSQQESSAPSQMDFNFGGNNNVEFGNSSITLNQTNSFLNNPNTLNPHMFSFSSSELNQQGTTNNVQNRKIRRMRSKRT